jgi:Holliday junction resolvase RusA-like endonuclease
MKADAKIMKSSYIQQVTEQYKGEIIEGDLTAIVELYFTNRLRRDRDNRHKISMDSMEGIIFKDDTQIQTAVVSKHLDKENPRIVIYLLD